jgi:hypothetical protein
VSPTTYYNGNVAILRALLPNRERASLNLQTGIADVRLRHDKNVAPPLYLIDRGRCGKGCRGQRCSRPDMILGMPILAIRG